MIRICRKVWQKVVEVLGGRIQAGVALAGIPLAFTIAGVVDSWNCTITSIFGIGVVVILGLTLAPWAPVLHRLRPPFGAPKVGITFRQIPQEDHHYPPHTVIVEVGVKPTTRLEDATVNLQYPREPLGHAGIRSLDGRGNEILEGNILPPRDFASTSPILWWWTHEDLRAVSKMFWFQLIPKEPAQTQTFKVVMVVASEKLYGQEATADFEVSYRPASSS
jgi:hypothetical protein